MDEKSELEQAKALHQAFLEQNEALHQASVNLWEAIAEAMLLPEIADWLESWLERIQLCFRRLIAR